MSGGKFNWRPGIDDSIGLIFLLERRLTQIFDKILAPSGLTTKQWLLLAVVNKDPEKKPAIMELAKELSTSHQNIKSLALQLEQKGFLRLVKDSKDHRVTRIGVTPKSQDFWRLREAEDKLRLMELFKTMTEGEKLILRKKLRKLLMRVNEIVERLDD